MPGTNLGQARRATATAAETAQFENYLTSSIPLGSRGTPDDLANLILYLASSASRYVTGQVFAHDGGLTALKRAIDRVWQRCGANRRSDRADEIAPASTN
jgi:NAD(P)-dependent dehydrogenase (short-subunit alcohol dehydrogenase family)